ncbi:hypothetical protein KIPB_000403 [Kipferlia bialata]|uniref:Uncharacterized protein n=1 Tax=Kipferlia bialata TaxID=797122 RepID=A0A391NRJ8_9EUKA|nr:hypothetical protein KIPB_000403 [Kipferlia bialata]|eukprot:g403.t1
MVVKTSKLYSKALSLGRGQKYQAVIELLSPKLEAGQVSSEVVIDNEEKYPRLLFLSLAHALWATKQYTTSEQTLALAGATEPGMPGHEAACLLRHQLLLSQGLDMPQDVQASALSILTQKGGSAPPELAVNVAGGFALCDQAVPAGYAALPAVKEAVDYWELQCNLGAAYALSGDAQQAAKCATRGASLLRAEEGGDFDAAGPDHTRFMVLRHAVTQERHASLDVVTRAALAGQAPCTHDTSLSTLGAVREAEMGEAQALVPRFGEGGERLSPAEVHVSKPLRLGAECMRACMLVRAGNPQGDSDCMALLGSPLLSSLPTHSLLALLRHALGAAATGLNNPKRLSPNVLARAASLAGISPASRHWGRFCNLQADPLFLVDFSACVSATSPLGLLSDQDRAALLLPIGQHLAATNKPRAGARLLQLCMGAGLTQTVRHWTGVGVAREDEGEADTDMGVSGEALALAQLTRVLGTKRRPSNASAAEERRLTQLFKGKKRTRQARANQGQGGGSGADHTTEVAHVSVQHHKAKGKGKGKGKAKGKGKGKGRR